VFVYVVTSYTAPRQTERLVARLRHDRPDARLIVSHDSKAPPPSTEVLADLRAELWLTPTPVTWGDASYLESLLVVIGRARLHDEDWITILTGQDYPIRPVREFEQHLGECGADMVLEEPDDPNLGVHLDRYRVRSYRLPRWADRHRIRQVAKHLPGIAISKEPRGLPPYLHRRRLRTPFGPSMELRKGCDLFALSGRAAEVLLSADPRLLRYYQHTRIPSESYIHTVLLNAPHLSNNAGMLHYARWRDSPHPEWLGEADLDDMRDSGLWFARKFQPDDPVLDRLDALLDDAAVA
jgi:hypothetical protein